MTIRHDGVEHRGQGRDAVDLDHDTRGTPTAFG